MTDHRLRAADRGLVRMLSEADLRRCGLRGIVLRSSRAVAVDIRDVVRVHTCGAQRALDRATGALPFGMRRRRVVAVGREAVAEDLREDRRTKLAREVLAQQDHHPAALSERQSVTVARVRSGRVRRERLEAVEPGVEDPGQRLRAARQHCVGLAVADELRRVPDRVRARRARGVHRQHGALGAERAGDRFGERLRRREEQEARIGVLPRRLLAVPLLGGEQSGVARPDDDAPALGRNLTACVDTALLDGLLRRLQREVDDRLAVVVRMVVVVLRRRLLLHLAADLSHVALHREVVDLPDRNVALSHVLPERVGVRPMRGDCADAADDDPLPFSLNRHEVTSSRTLR